MMAKVFQLDKEDGTKGPWQFFSEKVGAIIDAGYDEGKAQQMADGEAPGISIAAALEDTRETGDPENENDVDAIPEDAEADGLEGTQDAPAKSFPNANRPTAAPPVEKPRRTSSLTPAFIKKLKANLAAGTTNLSVELERFLINRFGFTTEELTEDDYDVEMLRMGWELQFEYWLADRDPPAWLIILFGQMCITLHLIATAKRKEIKANDEENESAPVTLPPED